MKFTLRKLCKIEKLRKDLTQTAAARRDQNIVGRVST